MPRRQPVAGRELGFADGAAAEPEALGLELRAGGAVDGPADPAAAAQLWLAALTIASTASAVMSPSTTRIRARASLASFRNMAHPPQLACWTIRALRSREVSLRQALPTVFSERRRRRHKLLNVAPVAPAAGRDAGDPGLVDGLGRRGPLGAVAGGLLPRPRSPEGSADVPRRAGRTRDPPEAHRLLQQLAARADLPSPPRLFYLPSSLLNAFAVGNRDTAAIAVTDGPCAR